VTVDSALIGAAVFFAAFGLLGWWMSRRKGLRSAGLRILLGVAGVYIGFSGVLENRHWLYAPGLALILASNAIQFVAWRRSAHGDAKTRGSQRAAAPRIADARPASASGHPLAHDPEGRTQLNRVTGKNVTDQHDQRQMSAVRHEAP
jgi:hypothetical protein